MVEKITATNMAQLVEETFAKCLFKEGEDSTGMIAVEGVVQNLRKVGLFLISA